MSLDRPREELNRRIDARVDAMFDQGLAEEVSRLRAAGFGPDDPGMQAIGYREFFATSATESSATEPSIAESSIALEAIRSAIKNDSRKYAKRQETFIRAIPAVRHFFAEDFVGIGAALADFAAEVGFSDESAT
jgi:tRNA dimethylallyltransferase